MNITADSAEVYIKQRRPIPAATIVAVGRLTAEERDELRGLRSAVKRIRVDLTSAEERAIRHARAADFWMVFSAVLFFATVYLAVGK